MRSSTLHKPMILALGILLLVSIFAILYIIVAPVEGEHYTEFYILGKDRTATGYPGPVNVGEPETVIIGVHNHEFRNVSYHIEIYLLKENSDHNTSVITAMELLDGFRIPLSQDQNEELTYTFVVNETGYNRLEFLLFDETVPSDQVMGRDRINASYRDLHLWI